MKTAEYTDEQDALSNGNTGSKLNRRQFLSGATVSAIGLALSGCGTSQKQIDDQSRLSALNILIADHGLMCMPVHSLGEVADAKICKTGGSVIAKLRYQSDGSYLLYFKPELNADPGDIESSDIVKSFESPEACSEFLKKKFPAEAPIKKSE